MGSKSYHELALITVQRWEIGDRKNNHNDDWWAKWGMAWMIDGRIGNPGEFIVYSDYSTAVDTFTHPLISLEIQPLPNPGYYAADDSGLEEILGEMGVIEALGQGPDLEELFRIGIKMADNPVGYVHQNIARFLAVFIVHEDVTYLEEGTDTETWCEYVGVVYLDDLPKITVKGV